MKQDVFQYFTAKYAGCLCEVLSEKGTLLFVGTLGAYDKGRNELDVELRRGEAAPRGVLYHAPVRLQIRSSRGGDHVVIMSGQVLRCAEGFWRLELTDCASHQENRQAFRQPVKLAASVCRLLEDGSCEEGGQRPCLLQDISLTGAGFLCRESYQPGDRLLLSQVFLRKGGEPYALPCQVVRREEPPEEPDPLPPKYGCRFFGLEARLQDRLYADILALQAESVKGTSPKR